MKTSELTGAALDWAVAKCEEMLHLDNAETWLRDYRIGFSTRYSTVWSTCGPIIEREKINLAELDGTWHAELEYLPTNDAHYRYGIGQGPTPLIAAMRCYVARKLGDNIEIPEGLK